MEVSLFVWLWDGTQWVRAYRCAPSIQNLGLEHFYAAFGLGCSRNLRRSAALALDIGESSISEDCAVAIDAARQLRPLQHGTPCEAQATKRAKTTVSDVAMQHFTEEDVDSSPHGSDSDASSSSQTASTADAEDVDTDLEELQDHYTFPSNRLRMSFSKVALPTHMARQRICLRRNGIFRKAERVWNGSLLSLRPGHWPGWCSLSGTWRNRWKHSCKPIASRRWSPVAMLKLKAPLSKGWLYILVNSWLPI